MKEILSDVRSKLKSGDYSNEEHVRLSLVARILQRLDWNIWDPAEVNAEFIVVPNEDKTRVDLALFLRTGLPAVFIEIKAVGQMEGRLRDVERQVRDYNRNNTALFSIITDGNEWRFYYSQTAGEFSQKLFDSFYILNDNLEDVERSFLTFLKKSELANDNARREAESYLKLGQKQRSMEDCLPEARRLINEAPFPSLPGALIDLLKEKGFSVTTDEAIIFIKEAAERKPITILQQHIQPSIPQTGFNHRSQAQRNRRQLNPENPTNLTHTKILEGRFADEKIANWVELMDCAMRTAQKNGVEFSFLRSHGNICEKNPGHTSFHRIEGTNLWIQGMDSNQAWKRALALAKKIGTELQVVVVWREKDGAAHPGEEAELKWSP